MAPIKSTRSSNPIKNETIKTNGVLTPNLSMTSGTLTPKQEDSGYSISDISEGGKGSFNSHNGFPAGFASQDEGYQTQERNIRSDAPSIRTSRASVDLTMGNASEPAPAGAGLQIVGEKVNLLVNAIKELRDLGLTELDTVLPELVLVGDQSAGKSSLMGAMAEINLPKDKGMCTRCPSNIKTYPSEDGTWSCTVSLHEYYTYPPNGKPSVSNLPFHPWIEKRDGLNVTAFATITDKRQLEEILRCAQAALLNPTQSPKSFVPGTGVNATKIGQIKHEADFSPNLVAIDITGPGLAALSLYDLPGIFVSAASQKQKYLVQVFENLATKYIKHKNALIICAMTMQNDPGLSRTSAIIEEQGAQGRCVGVLTMPDRLQDGSTHMDFDKILKGQIHRLGGGYFVTKQPGPDFLLRPGSDYHTQAREEEEAFFAKENTSWTGEWSEFLPRCGTKNFIEAISQKLATQIADSLDDIEQKINAQKDEVDTALLSLPELPRGTNVQALVTLRLQRFSNGVVNLLSGGPRSNGFLSSWSRLSHDFRDTIEKIKPMFTYQHPSDMVKIDREIIDLDSDNDEPATPTPHSTTNRKRPQLFETPPVAKFTKIKHDSSAGREGSVHSQSSSMQRPKLRPQGSVTPRGHAHALPTPFDDFSHIGKGFMSIGDIREIISRHHPVGVPGHFDEAVYEEICLAAIDPWKFVLTRLADETFKMLREAVLQMLTNCLGEYQQTQLYKTSKAHIGRFLAEREAEQHRVLLTLFDLESYKMFTVNDEIFELFKDTALKALQNARKSHRQLCAYKMNPPNNKLLEKAKERLEASKLDVGIDPFQKEVNVAAFARGYYKTAACRFTDGALQSIRGNLFRGVEMDIMGFLEGKLELMVPNAELKCRSLMEENAGQAERRTALLLKKEKLTKAVEKFNKLVEQYRSEDAYRSELSEDHGGDYDSPLRRRATNYRLPTAHTPPRQSLEDEEMEDAHMGVDDDANRGCQ